MHNEIVLDLLSDKSFENSLELLARHVHNRWMEGRLTDGWTYGPERNDEKKEHPSLVPYEELSESEKKYDRQTVMTTISCLLELGYEIKRNK